MEKRFFVKIIFIITLSAFVFSQTSFAQTKSPSNVAANAGAATGLTPEDVVRKYVAAVQQNDYRLAATMFHPQALKNFRMLQTKFFATVPPAELKQRGFDLAAFKLLSDQEFFAVVSEKLAKLFNLQEYIADSETEFVNTLTAPDGKTYVEFITTTAVPNRNPRFESIVVLEKFNGEYRVLLRNEKLDRPTYERLKRATQKPAKPSTVRIIHLTVFR